MTIGSSPIEVRFLGAGTNWMPICGFLSLGLGNYHSPLPSGSRVSVTTQEPGSAIFSGPELVAAGEYHFAITTPSWVAKLAVEGRTPFHEPLPLRTVAVFPHHDRAVLAVRRELGISSLREIGEGQIPLRISTPMRESRHPGVWVPEQLCELCGFTFDDIESWGGKILRDRPKFVDAEPGMTVIDPTFDAIFDEAIMTRRWPLITDQYDLRFLSLDDELLAAAAERGLPSAVLPKGTFRGMDEDVQTIDFSGWVLLCREDCPDWLVDLTARAVEERYPMINQWFSRPTMGLTSPVEMRDVGRDVPIPLHPAAEAFYRERSYL